MLIVTRCVDISGIVYGECVRHKIQKSEITNSLSISYATTLNTFFCFPVAKIRDFGEKCEVKVKNKKFRILRVHLCNLDHRCIRRPDF